MKQRALERSADRAGQSSTVKAVLARLSR